LEGLSSVTESIIEGIKSIFVPDTEKIQASFDTVKENFEFIDSFKELFTVITDSLQQDGVALSFTLDFSNSRGKYNYGGKAYAIDFKWYAEFKPAVDIIIIIFSYVGFILNVYRQLPNIINGGASISANSIHIQKFEGKKK